MSHHDEQKFQNQKYERDRLTQILRLIKKIDSEGLSDVEKSLIITELESHLGHSLKPPQRNCESMSQIVGGNMIGGMNNSGTQNSYHLNLYIFSADTVEKSLEMLLEKFGEQGIENLIEGFANFMQNRT